MAKIQWLNEFNEAYQKNVHPFYGKDRTDELYGGVKLVQDNVGVICATGKEMGMTAPVDHNGYGQGGTEAALELLTRHPEKSRRLMASLFFREKLLSYPSRVNEMLAYKQQLFHSLL